VRMRKIRMTWPVADVTATPAEPEPTAQLEPMVSEDHRELRGRAWLSLNSSTAAAAQMTIDDLRQFAIWHFEPTAVQLRQLQIQLDKWEARP
jgi:hypothetical protein